MRKKQTAATVTAEGRAVSADSSDLDADLDTCPALEPAPFRTIVGGDRVGAKPYLNTKNTAVVLIDLFAWKRVEVEKRDRNRWYAAIIERTWISLIAAGNQVQTMKIYLAHFSYFLCYDNELSAWAIDRDDMIPISISTLYMRDAATDRFIDSHMNHLESVVFVYITDGSEGNSDGTWLRLSAQKNVIAAHLHVYGDGTDAGDDEADLCQKYDSIYEHLPALYSYKYREVPKPDPVEKERESVSEEVKPVVPNDHPARNGDAFIRFLERAADVYERVA